MMIDSGTATVVSAIIAGITAIIVAKIGKGGQERRMLARAKGSIDKPTTGQSVPPTIDCAGKASVGAAADEVTFLLTVETAGLIWPKDATVIPDGSGRWAASIREAGNPDSFAVSLWAVTPQGAKGIQAWFDHGRATNDYPGFSILSGGRRLATVTGLRLGEKNRTAETKRQP